MGWRMPAEAGTGLYLRYAATKPPFGVLAAAPSRSLPQAWASCPDVLTAGVRTTSGSSRCRLRLRNRADARCGSWSQRTSHRALRRFTGSARCRTGFGHNELRRCQAAPGEKGPATVVCFSRSAGPFSPGFARPLPCLLCPRARSRAFGPAKAAPGAMTCQPVHAPFSIRAEPSAGAAGASSLLSGR
jgi:hypothetical protein